MAEFTRAATVEFDSPYQFRLLRDGEVLEIAGSFSWSVPQNLQVILASTPQVRIVSLNSPGGHVGPAMEVAEMVRGRGLITYVDRFCASACTLVFLAGKERWLAPNALLGFHQARAPGLSTADADAVLAAAYHKFALPPPFVAHVLRTPPTDLWFPKFSELRAAQIVTGPPPEAIFALNRDLSWSLTDSLPLVRISSDRSVVEFGVAVSEILGQLLRTDPEACWAFANQGAVDLEKRIPQSTLQAYKTAENRMTEDINGPLPTTLDAGQRDAAVAELKEFLAKNGLHSVGTDLQLSSDHAAFCQSLYGLFRAAFMLPEAHRIRALRMLLGSR